MVLFQQSQVEKTNGINVCGKVSCNVMCVQLYQDYYKVVWIVTNLKSVDCLFFKIRKIKTK